MILTLQVTENANCIDISSTSLVRNLLARFAKRIRFRKISYDTQAFDMYLSALFCKNHKQYFQLISENARFNQDKAIKYKTYFADLSKVSDYTVIFFSYCFAVKPVLFTYEPGMSSAGEMHVASLNKYSRVIKIVK